MGSHVEIERLKRLEFRLDAKSSQHFFPTKVHVRDVPLVRGYKHERSKRPASFCRISVHQPPIIFNDSTTVNFYFGWFRRTISSRYGVGHELVMLPDGDFHCRYTTNEHAEVEEFEKEMTDLIRVLHSHSFESIQELYDFMASWTGTPSKLYGWMVSHSSHS